MIPIVKADGTAEQQLLSALRSRAGEVDKKVTESVSEILDRVRREGDAAVQYYTEKFDGSLPPAFEVDREEINDALTNADPAFVEALLNAQANTAPYQNRQKRESFIDPQPDGVTLGQRIRGLHRVGLYVPGGTAAYPSSVLMNAIPAKIAGVGEIIMVTPPLKDGRANPDILVAAAICGVDRVFLMGGAQAVAALAYGTETVPRVGKIVGPGNIYVAPAKKLLYGTVDIDMIAGPSEILVLADESADPVYVAADLMSQAEHDRLASAILITTSGKLAEETVKELSRQMQHLSRKEIIDESLTNFGGIIVCDDMDTAVALANQVAPEHLELSVDNPFLYLGQIDNAGSVFMGHFSPEPLGDYYAGPNHVLPTSGTARFFSPLSVDTFTKKSSFIYYTKDALEAASGDIVTLAEKEGLTAHAGAIKVRFPEKWKE